MYKFRLRDGAINKNTSVFIDYSTEKYRFLILDLDYKFGVSGIEHLLTLSRLRGTHLGTLSDFLWLLSNKNDSLEERKI